jgi:hypothetical protein
MERAGQGRGRPRPRTRAIVGLALAGHLVRRRRVLVRNGQMKDEPRVLQ